VYRPNRCRLRGHDGISVIPAETGSMRRVDLGHYAADAPWGAGSPVNMKPSFFLRFCLGLWFTATGLAKLLDNRGFAQVIASYQLGLPGLFLLPLGLCVSLRGLDRYQPPARAARAPEPLGHAALPGGLWGRGDDVTARHRAR
jgi:hypothetical protein